MVATSKISLLSNTNIRVKVSCGFIAFTMEKIDELGNKGFSYVLFGLINEATILNGFNACNIR